MTMHRASPMPRWRWRCRRVLHPAHASRWRWLWMRTWAPTPSRVSRSPSTATSVWRHRHGRMEHAVPTWCCSRNWTGSASPPTPWSSWPRMVAAQHAQAQPPCMSVFSMPMTTVPPLPRAQSQWSCPRMHHLAPCCSIWMLLTLMRAPMVRWSMPSAARCPLRHGGSSASTRAQATSPWKLPWTTSAPAPTSWTCVPRTAGPAPVLPPAPSSCASPTSMTTLRASASAPSVAQPARPALAYVSEAAATESFVALVSATDRDSGANGQVRCSLRGHDHFALQRAYEDSYMIVTTAALDRERIPEYNLTVVAEDLGSPPFKTVRQYTVRVSDENDNAPLFAKPLYEVAVPENNPPGAYITTVVARDPDLGHNGKVTYRLLETQVMGAPISTYVSVDPATGAIYALRTFNYEILKQLDLRIQATDGGSPQLSSSTVVKVRMVDQNDNPPVIIHPVLTNGTVEIGVSSKTSRDSLVAQIKARDADDGANAELTFAFLEESQQDLFTINPSTGDIVLRGDLSEELGQLFKVILTVTDNGRPPLATTATVNFLVTATAPSSIQDIAKPSSWEGKALQWDIPLIVIIVLAGSCTLLLVAIITIATTCNRRKKGNNIKNNTALKDQIDISHLEKGHQEEGSQKGNVFEVRTFPSKTCFTSPDPSPAAEEIPTTESGSDSTCLYEGQKRLRGQSGEQGFAATPSYNKEPAPPVAIWKGHSFNTISGREAEKFSGKDSGKGDSDFNDSDSDISGDALKKDLITHMQNGLWACTAECKILGHSDRCWSPSCGRANPHPSPYPSAPLSTFCKSTSLPRDPLRRDNFYQAQLPKTVGLQSVYEKVLHRDFDRTITLLSPPRPARLPDLQEIGVPLFPAPSTRYLGPQTETTEKA
uniref:Protocadherin 8 n=1 Tax=Geospiza parvula TaxID=87175 RepID=A0A8U8BRU3_GEOPR